jgi:hypothetical protein
VCGNNVLSEEEGRVGWGGGNQMGGNVLSEEEGRVGGGGGTRWGATC